MEYVEGCKISDVDAIKELGLSLYDVSTLPLALTTRNRLTPSISYLIIPKSCLEIVSCKLFVGLLYTNYTLQY